MKFRVRLRMATSTSHCFRYRLFETEYFCDVPHSSHYRHACLRLGTPSVRSSNCQNLVDLKLVYAFFQRYLELVPYLGIGLNRRRGTFYSLLLKSSSHWSPFDLLFLLVVSI
jgi:hypothetical protein